MNRDHSSTNKLLIGLTLTENDPHQKSSRSVAPAKQVALCADVDLDTTQCAPGNFHLLSPKFRSTLQLTQEPQPSCLITARDLMLALPSTVS